MPCELSFTCEKQGPYRVCPTKGRTNKGKGIDKAGSFCKQCIKTQTELASTLGQDVHFVFILTQVVTVFSPLSET